MKIAIKPKQARLDHPSVEGLSVVVRRLTNTQRRILQEQSARMLQRVVEEQIEGKPMSVDMEQAMSSMASTLKAAIVNVEDTSGRVLEQLREVYTVEGDEFAYDEEFASAIIDALWNESLSVPNVEQPCICVGSVPRAANGRRLAAGQPCELCGDTKRRNAPMLFPVWLVGKVAASDTFGPPADIDPKGSQPQ